MENDNTFIRFDWAIKHMLRDKSNFEILEGHTGMQLIVRTGEDGVIVPHLPKDVFPEYYLLRVRNYDKIPDSPLDEWMSYLKTGKVKEDTRTPGLQRVREKLKVLTMNKGEREAYYMNLDSIMVQNDVLDTARMEGREEGFAEGKTQGMAEGKAQGMAEGMAMGREDEKNGIARKMLVLGMPMETIIEVTGLSAEEIDKIK